MFANENSNSKMSIREFQEQRKQVQISAAAATAFPASDDEGDELTMKPNVSRSNHPFDNNDEDDDDDDDGDFYDEDGNDDGKIEINPRRTKTALPSTQPRTRPTYCATSLPRPTNSAMTAGDKQAAALTRPQKQQQQQQQPYESTLTPKERMIMNKLKKADEQAAKFGQVAKENYEERMQRQSFLRDSTIGGSVC